MVKAVSVLDLKDHPKNSYFFDDIEGTRWEEFLASVQRNGIINPIVITSDNVIISGHQRVRACKALGINEIKAFVMDWKNEDDILLALIESNIRQRGVVNSPSIKLGRMLKELERIYGLDKNSGVGRPKNVDNVDIKKTPSQLREDIGISKDTDCYSKALADLPDEYEELISTGVISVSTAARLIAKLDPDQQIELFNTLDSTKRYTQKQIQEAIQIAFPKAERIDELESRLAEYQKNTDVTEIELRDKIRELTQKERDTYEKMMSERKQHRSQIADYERRMEKLEECVQESDEYNDRTEEYINQISDLEERNEQLENDAKIARNDADLILICSAIKSLSDALNEASCDPSELTGDLAVTAEKYIADLEEKLSKISARLSWRAA